MPKVETLTKLEWEIMKHIWKNGQATVRDVHAVVNFYSAKVKEAETLKRETSHFVKRAFDGSFSKLAAFLFDTQNFNAEDLETIKRLIQEKERKND